MSEPNELVDGYDPADPPQGNHWCRECSSWDDDCVCGNEPEEEYEPLPIYTPAICHCCGARATFKLEGEGSERFRGVAHWMSNHGCNYGRLLLTDRSQ